MGICSCQSWAEKVFFNGQAGAKIIPNQDETAGFSAIYDQGGLRVESGNLFMINGAEKQGQAQHGIKGEAWR